MTLSTEQIKLLESYRDKAYICNILCDESFNHYSFIKNLVNLPLILSSSVMTVLNSSDFDAQTMRIPNIVLNASTTLILSLINNYKLPEKCQTFRSKSIKYMHLCNQIEDSLTNDLNNINIDKIRNFINDYDAITESLEYSYPTHIKNRVRKKFKNSCCFFCDYLHDSKYSVLLIGILPFLSSKYILEGPTLLDRDNSL
jgi:hypothetical protein